GVFFRLADVVIMAGSFSEKIGGHNPLEAARLGKAVVTGPDLYNWDSVYAPLFEAGAAFKVLSRDELELTVRTLLDAPAARLDAHRIALALAQRGDDTLPAVMARLKPFIPVTPPPLPPQDEVVDAA
ncbi:MAG: 3-deoxy-D-manno-octulosonic acid transferase, partial [Asticcacaulis sp.]